MSNYLCAGFRVSTTVTSAFAKCLWWSTSKRRRRIEKEEGKEEGSENGLNNFGVTCGVSARHRCCIYKIQKKPH
jgi:hypothetical protein